MKAVRMTVLAMAVALGTNTLAKAYAGDGAVSQGPRHAPQDAYDQITAQSDLLALAELLMLGLALLEQPTSAGDPCSGCAPRVERRTGVSHER